MEKQPNKKLAMLYILQILQRYSDYDHRLTQDAILQKLATDYGIELERRSVGRNIELLKAAGFDIRTNHANGAYLNGRDFSDGEIRYLIDAVLFSPHIQERYARELVEKLLALGSVTFTDGMRSVSTVKETFHEKNADLFDNIDEISRAIETRNKVVFEYVKYELAQGESGGELFAKKKTDDVFAVNPYRLIAHGGNYYLLGSYDGDPTVVAFRVDKIFNLQVSDETAADVTQSELANKTISDFIFAHPYMYAGRTERVQLKIPMYFLDEVINTFGKNVGICTHDDWHFRVTVNAGVNDITEWVMQNSRYAELLSPDYLRQRVAKRIAGMADSYGVLTTVTEKKKEKVQATDYPYNLLTMIFGEQYKYSDDKAQIMSAIDEQTECLLTDEKIVIKKLYVFGDSREDAAKELGVTTEDLIMSEASALRKLRHPSHSRNLTKFILD